jgi:peptidyl-prolyl cis-trans isomerase B (cyclophilin B)
MNRRNLIIVIVIAVVAIALSIRNYFLSHLPSGGLTQGNSVILPTDAVTPAAISGRPLVEIATSKGKITLELRPDLAPKTVTNFLSKWANDYCTGKTFHRVEDWVVQGCDPKGDGTGGSDTLATEVSDSSFTAGAVGVARKPYPREISNDSQFFIVKKDSTFLNGDYTYFGRVIAGQDVVNSLSIGDKIISTTLLGK